MPSSLTFKIPPHFGVRRSLLMICIACCSLTLVIVLGGDNIILDGGGTGTLDGVGQVTYTFIFKRPTLISYCCSHGMMHCE